MLKTRPGEGAKNHADAELLLGVPVAVVTIVAITFIAIARRLCVCRRRRLDNRASRTANVPRSVILFLERRFL